MAIKHPFVSGKADGADTTLVRPSNWDAAHTIENDTITYAMMQNVSATDKLLGRSTAGAGDAEEIACTAFGRSIIDDATEAAFKATVNLEIGVDVQAYDAELAALAGLVSAADKLPYFTGLGTASLADFTAAGRALVDDTTAAAQLITLGLTATAAELNALDGITSTVTELNYTDGVTSAIQTQIDGKQASLGFTAENAANKDATGGYAGLTLFKINFKNVLNTIISFFTNSNTVARTYTFQDRDGTIADNTDLATKQNALTNSAGLAAALSDETGTGLAVFNNSPALVTPVLGTPTSGLLTNCTGLPTAGLVDDAITYAKIQNVSATDKVLGRATAGAGDVEEIACTALSRTMLAGNLPKFSAHKNGVDQTGIVTATSTKMTATTEAYDVGGGYDAANSKWTPGIVGYAHIDACALWSVALTAGTTTFNLFLNGVMYRQTYRDATATPIQGVEISLDVPVAAITDYFEIYVYQSSGANKDILGAAQYTWWMGHMLP